MYKCKKCGKEFAFPFLVKLKKGKGRIVIDKADKIGGILERFGQDVYIPFCPHCLHVYLRYCCDDLEEVKG